MWSGFYGVSRLTNIGFVGGLVSALVERWRPETHTFHFPQGVCTITLEDVAMQLGLPCGGIPVCGHTGLNWGEVCGFYLGIIPPPEQLDGQRLSLVWLQENFNQLNENATEVEVQQFARAYILRLIGGMLMVDYSSHYVYLMYLPLLGDLQQAGTYSWGSVVLAHLYRELCNATNKNQKEIAGCQTLVHMWAWDRFPWLAPNPLPYHELHEDEYVVPPPLGIRWSGLYRSVRPPLTIQRQIRMRFDQMIEDDIVWRPFHTLEIPQHYNQNPDIWRAQLPLICFHILEWHHPDRVMRQFGFDQPIPKAPVDLGVAHTIKLSSKTMVNWSQRQHDYAAIFADWPSRVCMGTGSSRPLRRHSEYMQWYSRHTRRWIDPASATSGHAANVIEYIRKIARPVDDQLGGIIDKKCNEALQAIGEITETLTFDQQRAPDGPTFSNPPMRPGGTRRGTRGFHVARDPIMPVDDFDMGAMPSPPHIPVSPPHVDGGANAASTSQVSVGDADVATSSRIPVGGTNDASTAQVPVGGTNDHGTFGSSSHVAPSATGHGSPAMGDADNNMFAMYAEYFMSSPTTPIQVFAPFAQPVDLNENPPTPQDDNNEGQVDEVPPQPQDDEVTPEVQPRARRRIKPKLCGTGVFLSKVNTACPTHMVYRSVLALHDLEQCLRSIKCNARTPLNTAFIDSARFVVMWEYLMPPSYARLHFSLGTLSIHSAASLNIRRRSPRRESTACLRGS
ncbi:serine/threonine-protein phosphatase 7 long form-like protein [Senna tora]|uniref:Serine/threonine-protein phosphatase 7 long form-like protein n=1 Tax=Senna tora TaxID=362788 RepID=A0A834TIT0_9FABA|nr:serine/threonine-protein phosphatase 7 long form-like protein [Senna tora]